MTLLSWVHLTIFKSIYWCLLLFRWNSRVRHWEFLPLKAWVPIGTAKKEQTKTKTGHPKLCWHLVDRSCWPILSRFKIWTVSNLVAMTSNLRAMAFNLIASLLLVAMPFAPSSFLLPAVRPGAPSSVLAPSSDHFWSKRQILWSSHPSLRSGRKDWMVGRHPFDSRHERT